MGPAQVTGRRGARDGRGDALASGDPERVRPRWGAPVDSTDYDCRACGACCLSPFAEQADYARLTPAEREHFVRVGLPVVDRADDSCLGTKPHGTDGTLACVAFTGTVGGSCGCTVYEDRPRVCRTFEAGGLQCRIARHDAGLGPRPPELDSWLDALR